MGEFRAIYERELKANKIITLILCAAVLALGILELAFLSREQRMTGGSVFGNIQVPNTITIFFMIIAVMSFKRDLLDNNKYFILSLPGKGKKVMGGKLLGIFTSLIIIALCSTLPYFMAGYRGVSFIINNDSVSSKVFPLIMYIANLILIQGFFITTSVTIYIWAHIFKA